MKVKETRILKELKELAEQLQKEINTPEATESETLKEYIRRLTRMIKS